MPSSKACSHTYGAEYGCEECVRDVRARYSEFPLQTSRPPVKPGPMHIPWPVAEQSWAAYAARYGKQQSVERLAERGGFSWGEMDQQLPGWREMVDPYRNLLEENARLKAAQMITTSKAAPDSSRGERVTVECPDCDAWVILAPNEAVDRGMHIGRRAAADHLDFQPLGAVRALHGICPKCDAQIALLVARPKSATVPTA